MLEFGVGTQRRVLWGSWSKETGVLDTHWRRLTANWLPYVNNCVTRWFSVVCYGGFNHVHLFTWPCVTTVTITTWTQSTVVGSKLVVSGAYERTLYCRCDLMISAAHYQTASADSYVARCQLLCFASGPPRYVLWSRVYTMQVGSPESTRRDAHADVSWKSHDVNAAARIKKNSLGKFDGLKF